MLPSLLDKYPKLIKYEARRESRGEDAQMDPGATFRHFIRFACSLGATHPLPLLPPSPPSLATLATHVISIVVADDLVRSSCRSFIRLRRWWRQVTVNNGKGNEGKGVRAHLRLSALNDEFSSSSVCMCCCSPCSWLVGLFRRALGSENGYKRNRRCARG